MSLRFHSRDATTRLRALGRLPAGQMNQTEARYEAEVLKPALQAGEVLWYRFEGIKLRLADKTFLTVDFAVMPKSRVMELHDVKGSRVLFMDDARAKMKVAAEAYPFVFKVIFPLPKKAGWEVEEI